MPELTWFSKCVCGQILHDGACYEISPRDAEDAVTWEKLFRMTPEERALAVEGFHW